MKRLRRTIENNPGRTVGHFVGVSLEHWCGARCFLREFLGAPDTKIVIYVRPYTQWIRSKYLQQSRAKGSPDFDTVFANSFNGLSIKAVVSDWAEAFGKESLHIHHVAALPDRDVVADFLGLIEATVLDPAEANRSPHWLTCEFARAMFAYSSASRSLYKQKGQFRPFLAEIDRVVRGPDPISGH